MYYMANKKTSGKDKEQSQPQPFTPQMEKEQPIVNEQEQNYPVNPQDNMPAQNSSEEDFTSEKEMNQRSQQEENTTQQQQMSEQDKEDIEADSEDVDNGLNKIPKMNP